MADYSNFSPDRQPNDRQPKDQSSEVSNSILSKKLSFVPLLPLVGLLVHFYWFHPIHVGAAVRWVSHTLRIGDRWQRDQQLDLKLQIERKAAHRE